MNTQNRIEIASNIIREWWKKYGIQEPLSFLGFCLSLLPVPVISQAGTILDRH